VTTARQAAQRGDLDQARAAYTQAIAESPESGFLYRELAIVQGRQGATAEAIASFRKAISLDPSDVRSHVLLGDALLAAGDTAGAVTEYTAAHRLDPSPEIAAKLEAADERAARERLPAAYKSIATAPAVTRADVAAALAIEAPALLAALPQRQGALMTDVRGHWAATWILQAVRAGLMEPLPNHTFQPDGPVRRADFAAIAARGLTLLAATAPGGSEAPRPAVSDVPPGSPAYPAVAQVVGAGVMQLDNGAFEPQRPLTGPELVAAAARLGELAASRSPGRPPVP
jgi:tetratricopeptide (TPR) repeat protein